MYQTFFPNQMDDFPKFYRRINAKKYTTASLHQFFFDHRKCDKILDKLGEFLDIIREDSGFDGKNMYC